LATPQKNLLLLVLLILIPVLLLFRNQIASTYYLRVSCERNRQTTWNSYGTPVPPGYAVHGIDVSHHSCHIDWEEVKKTQFNGVKISFAYMRATKGFDLDYLFAENWRETKDNKILRGAYHYYIPEKDAKLQAEFFLKHVRHEAGDLPPVLDIEQDDGFRDETIIEGMKIWLKIVENATGVKPMIYTNLFYYKKYIQGNFNQYPIWIANYKSNRVTLPDGRIWWFWQFSEKTRVNGVSEAIDFNIFNGNSLQLKGICIK
jgi:lysozyme